MASKRRKSPSASQGDSCPLPMGLPEDVTLIRREISRFFDQLDESGRKIGNSKHGVYAFYDYDGEPIYVGQTFESLRQRIGRHLTNQRTDAVAMNVLDPFEVAEIEMWPLDAVVGAMPEDLRLDYLNKAEYTVFQYVLRTSELKGVLNEKVPAGKEEIPLPQSFRQRIIPDSIYGHRKHPDIRIARRASTIANLARVISERDVSPGLRRTLLTQARRLERLAEYRVDELGINKTFGSPNECSTDDSEKVEI